MLRHPFAAVAALALSLGPSAARAAQAWVAGSTEKIRPDAASRGDSEAHLSAARNEFEAFQVVVTGAAGHVSAAASKLTGPGNMGEVKLFREDLIQLQHPSALDGGTGPWPDALVPDVDDVVGEKRNAFPFDVRDGESRAIWVEVHVPEDAAPGTYHGRVTVTSDQATWEIPVTLDVWDFTLPSTASLRSSFGLSYGGILSGHPGVTGDAFSTLRARYGQLGLDHRISLTGVSDDGSKGLDDFDQYFGALLDGRAPTQLPGARLTAVKYMGDETSTDQHALWAQHFKDHGWFDRLFDYVCDEPPLTCQWGDIGARAQAAHAADPGFRTLVTTQIWDAQDHGVDRDIDLIVPVVNWIDDKPGSPVAGDQRARYDGFLSSGKDKEVWLYQSCMSHGCGGTVDIGNPSEDDRYFTGWPSYMVDASAVRNRAMEWVSFLERASGELYWETTAAYSHDPWSNLWDFSGNGDGTLFYPGTPARIGGHTDVPVASLRLKMIREGMEDFEYLKLIADGGDRATAEKIARDLFPNAYSTDVDPARLAAARAQLAARILQLQGKPVPATLANGATAGAGGGGGGCGSGGAASVLALLAWPAVMLAKRRGRRVR
jgi:hypothetical protein